MTGATSPQPNVRERMPDPAWRLLDLLASIQIDATHIDDVLDGMAAKRKADGEPGFHDRPINVPGLREVIEYAGDELPKRQDLLAGIGERMAEQEWSRTWAGRAYELASCLYTLRQHLDDAVHAAGAAGSLVDDATKPSLERWTTRLIADLHRLGTIVVPLMPAGTKSGILDDVLSAAMVHLEAGAPVHLGDELGFVNEACRGLQGLDGANDRQTHDGVLGTVRVQVEGNNGKSPAETKSKSPTNPKSRRTKIKDNPQEIERRRSFADGWNDAKAAGVKFAKYCEDESVTPEKGRAILQWCRDHAE